MDLFKDEIYKMMEEKLKSSSEHNGIEEALRMINHDKKLQNFIRKYAVKNGISCRGWGEYGHGNYDDNTLACKDILIWKQKGEYPASLTIGPDPEKEIMPIFLNHYKPGDWLTDMFYENLLIEERTGGFYLQGDPWKIKYHPELLSKHHGRRITDTGIFEGVSAEEILYGLEKAIAILLKRKLPGFTCKAIYRKLKNSIDKLVIEGD